MGLHLLYHHFVCVVIYDDLAMNLLFLLNCQNILKVVCMVSELLCLSYEIFFLKVLVHGSAEATEHLKQHCLKHVCPHVYTPQIEETIDVTSDLCAYKV